MNVDECLAKQPKNMDTQVSFFDIQMNTVPVAKHFRTFVLDRISDRNAAVIC